MSIKKLNLDNPGIGQWEFYTVKNPRIKSQSTIGGILIG